MYLLLKSTPCQGKTGARIDLHDEYVLRGYFTKGPCQADHQLIEQHRSEQSSTSMARTSTVNSLIKATDSTSNTWEELKPRISSA